MEDCGTADERQSDQKAVPVSAAERVLGAVQAEMRACPYCLALFEPKRARQDFCGPKCRKAYHDDIGTLGTVASVIRIKRGVSVVLHFDSGPAAERAVLLLKGERKRVV